MKLPRWSSLAWLDERGKTGTASERWRPSRKLIYSMTAYFSDHTPCDTSVGGDVPEVVSDGHTGMDSEITSAPQEDSITTAEVHNEENLPLDIISYRLPDHKPVFLIWL